ncbi:MAG: hypothetical protein ACE5EA_02700 [Nitrospirota bacterium]
MIHIEKEIKEIKEMLAQICKTLGIGREPQRSVIEIKRIADKIIEKTSKRRARMIK